MARPIAIDWGDDMYASRTVEPRAGSLDDRVMHSGTINSCL